MKPLRIFLLLAGLLLASSRAEAQFSISKVTPKEADVKNFRDTIKQLSAVNNQFFSEARYRAEKKRLRKERNTITCTVGLSLNQTGFDNWAPGGNNTFDATASLLYTHVYTRDKLNMTYSFDSKYGMNVISGTTFKNLDYFIFNLNTGWAISKNWSYSASANLRSQWSKGYKSVTEKILVSNFMSPGTLTLGVGFTYTGSTYCATGWYPDKRGLASGLCMAFNGGSATFLAPLIVKLIGSIGIIVTLYIVGGAIIVIGICAAIGLKTAPVGYAPAGWKAKADDPKLAATQLESLTPGQAFRTRGYWHLFLGYGLFPTMYIICYPRFSVLISDAGYSLSAATIGVSIYSISNVIGRLGMGALIDKLGYRKVYTICGICSVASSLCLMFAHSLAMFYIAYVLLAVGFGATNCCHPVAVQETYGSKYAGGIFGICMLGYMIICTFISPKISSALVKATGGSYTASMIYAIIACIIAVAVYTTIPMPKRRTLAEVAAEEKAAQEKAAQA